MPRLRNSARLRKTFIRLTPKIYASDSWVSSCWQHMPLVLAVAEFTVPKRKWNPNWARNFCKNWVSKEAGRELATVYLAILMGKSQRLHPVKITVCIM